MKSCHDPHHDNEPIEKLAPESSFAVLFFVFLFFSLLGLGIGIRDYLNIKNPSSARFNLILSIVVSSLIIYYGYCCASEANALYQIQKDGILMKYPFRKSILLHWDRFQEICVCYADITTRGPMRYNTVICCVQHGERRNFYDRWKTDNAFHYQKVIKIAFNDSRLSELQENCPFKILDRRGRDGYRLR